MLLTSGYSPTFCLIDENSNRILTEVSDSSGTNFSFSAFDAETGNLYAVQEQPGGGKISRWKVKVSTKISKWKNSKWSEKRWYDLFI